jgi:release factor glutamine methyltransferase
LQIAQQNAKRYALNISFYQSNWFAHIPSKTFDLIVSNPPYIEANDPHLTQGDLRFEPLNALSSGQDGLEDLRLIISQAKTRLNPQGWLAVEHGYNQAEPIAQLFRDKGYQNIHLYYDLAGQPRVTAGQIR